MLLPRVDLIEQSRWAIDELIDVAGRPMIEAISQLSAEQVAGPRTPGRRREESGMVRQPTRARVPEGAEAGGEEAPVAREGWRRGGDSGLCGDARCQPGLKDAGRADAWAAGKRQPTWYLDGLLDDGDLVLVQLEVDDLNVEVLQVACVGWFPLSHDSRARRPSAEDAALSSE